MGTKTKGRKTVVVSLQPERQTDKPSALDTMLTPRVRKLIILLLTVFPAVVVLFFIKYFGANVAFADQWDFVPFLEKMYTGHLSFGDFFAQHNEHRLIFPRAVMAVLALLTHYNNVAEMYFGLFVMCLTGYVFFLVYRRIFGTGESSLWAFVPISLLVFSLKQSGNILWGWQIQIFMLTFFFLAAVYLLDTLNSSRNRFLLALASAIGATFSFANGMMVWPVGLLQLFLEGRAADVEKKNFYYRAAGIWGLTGIIVGLSYFHGYVKPTQHPSLLSILRSPMDFINYVLGSVGVPLAIGEFVLPVGAVLLIGYLFLIPYYMKHYSTSRARIALPLILFSLISSLVMAVGRSGFGPEQALASRYVTITYLGIAGLYMAAFSFVREKKRFSNFIYGFILLYVFFSMAIGYTMVLRATAVKATNYDIMSYCIKNYRYQSDNALTNYYPAPDVVMDRASILERYRLNVFSEPFIKLPEVCNGQADLFYADMLNDISLSDNGNAVITIAGDVRDIQITGWAIDEKLGKCASGVYVAVDDRINIPALYARYREDVAQSLGNDDYAYSGFAAIFSSSVAGKGRHTLSFKVIGADGKGYYEAKRKITLEVR
ncbi:MAG: hypothetical protein PHT33_09575 [bacterium]|nr:hypothetical protein [bacterium]